MKNIFKNTVLIFILVSFISCEKGFEDLNKNPYATTLTSVGPLFNNVVSSLQLGWNEQLRTQRSAVQANAIGRPHQRILAKFEHRHR
jgi:hypothetical protein